MTSILLPFRPAIIGIDLMLVVIGCVCFYMAPSGFDAWIGWTCLVIFYALTAVLITFPAGLTRQVPVVLTTELAFTLFFFILFYLPYQQHLLGILDYAPSTRVKYTSPMQANAALIIATLSYAAFHLGALINRAIPIQTLPEPRERLESYALIDIVLPLLLIVSIVAYQVSGLQSSNMSRYTASSNTGTSAVAEGLYVVLITLCLLVVSRCITRRARGVGIPPMLWVGLAVVFVWMMQMLLAGDRNNFLIIALAGAGGFAALIGKVRFPIVVVSIMLAYGIYNIIEITRMSSEVGISAALETIDTHNAKKRDRDSSFNTTTITMRSALENVPADTGFGNGSYFANGMLGIIPLIRGVVNTNSQFDTTSGLLTYHMVGPDASWSVGTNVVADAYINFGLGGVVICSAVIGMLIGASRKAIQRNGLGTRTTFLFVGTIGLIGELPRYTLTFPIRIVVWGYLILLVLEMIFGLKQKKNMVRQVPAAQEK